MSDKNYHFHLYVCSDGNEVSELVHDLHELLTEYTKNKYELEVKNLFENDNSASAAADAVFSVPALVKKIPAPIKHIVGDMTNAKAVLLLVDNNHEDKT